MTGEPTEDQRTRAHEATRGPMASGERHSLLGAFLGPYAILGEIARGGMGAVYRARKAGESDVALKVLLKLDRATPEMLRRFEREIRTGRTLDHPGIVKVLDAGTIENKPYFAMELVEGTPFGQLGLPLEERIRIIEKVCRAVGHAHARAIVHRDLKPPNILVSPSLEPKVLDFGLAKSLDKESLLTQEGAILGTFAYMAPEQADGRHDAISPATDVWALGAILYETLTGAVPFKADSHVALLARILNQEARDPLAIASDCPKPLAAVALRALEKEQALRFRDANELADELARWLAVGEVETRARSAWSRFLRRRRRSLVQGGLVLAALTGAAVYVVSLRGREAQLRARDLAATEKEAREALARFVRSNEAPPPVLVVHLRELAGEPVRPADREQRATSKNATDDLAHALRGAEVAASGAHTDADLPDLLAAASRAPDQLVLRKAIAERFLARGSPDRAVAFLDSASAAKLAAELGDEERLRGTHDPLFLTDPGAAIQALRLKARDGATPELAWTLLRAERGEEALSDFDRLLAGARGLAKAEALAGKGEALVLLARDDDAISSLESAIKDLEANPDLRGDFVERRARARLAQLRRQGKDRDPRDGPRLVRASRVAFRRWLRHAHEADAALARTLLDLAEKLAPDAPTVRVERARQTWESSSKRLEPSLVETISGTDEPTGALIVAVACLDANQAPRARELASRILGQRIDREIEAAAHAVLGIAIGDPSGLDELEKAIVLWRGLERNQGQDRLEVLAWGQKAKYLEALHRSEDAERAQLEATARGGQDRFAGRDCYVPKDNANFDDPLGAGSGDRSRYTVPLRRRHDLDPFDPYTNVNIGKNVFFRGELAAELGDPWICVGRGMRIDPTSLNDLLGLRSFLHSMSTLFSMPEGTESLADEDAVWARIAQRSIVVLDRSDAIETKEALALRLDCERALVLDPSSVAAIMGRGYLHALADERGHALEDAMRAQSYYPKSVFEELALMLAELSGEPDEPAKSRALEHLERAASVDPRYREQNAKAIREDYRRFFGKMGHR